MARGKKLSPEEIYKVMASWAVTDNYSETARQMGMPVSTVKKVVEGNRYKDEFVKLCEEKRGDFVKNASRIRDKALARLEREIDNKKIQIPVNQLTTVVGTLYDKIALAEGKSTSNTEVSIKLPEEMMDYAE